MTQWHIYGLCDPREPSLIRYVGFTTLTKRRLRAHINNSRKGVESNLHKARWINQLLAEGVEPVMIIIEKGCGDGWAQAEQDWIAHARSWSGSRLTNLNDGGGGMFGLAHSAETRAKISAANKGRKQSDAAKLAISAGNKGKGKSPEASAKSGAARQGQKRSEEARAKSAAANIGRPVSAETRAKLAAIHQGRVRSPESIAKQRDTARRNRESKTS